VKLQHDGVASKRHFLVFVIEQRFPNFDGSQHNLKKKKLRASTQNLLRDPLFAFRLSLSLYTIVYSGIQSLAVPLTLIHSPSLSRGEILLSSKSKG